MFKHIKHYTSRQLIPPQRLGQYVHVLVGKSTGNTPKLFILGICGVRHCRRLRPPISENDHIPMGFVHCSCLESCRYSTLTVDIATPFRVARDFAQTTLPEAPSTCPEPVDEQIDSLSKERYELSEAKFHVAYTSDAGTSITKVGAILELAVCVASRHPAIKILQSFPSLLAEPHHFIPPNIKSRSIGFCHTSHFTH
jgi:hypothetical protein